MTPADEALRLLGEALVRLADAPTPATVTVTHTVTASFAWSAERLWSAPPETQIDTAELAAALAVTRGAIHRRVTHQGLPCRRTKDGAYVFIVGVVREWLTEQQEIVNPFTPRVASRPRRLK